MQRFDDLFGLLLGEMPEDVDLSVVLVPIDHGGPPRAFFAKTIFLVKSEASSALLA